jgi:hypothetical protein
MKKKSGWQENLWSAGSVASLVGTAATLQQLHALKNQHAGVPGKPPKVPTAKAPKVPVVKSAAEVNYFEHGMDKPYKGRKIVRDHAITSRTIYPDELLTKKLNTVHQENPVYSRDPWKALRNR